MGPAFSDNTGFVNEVVKRNEVEQGFVFIVSSLITSFNYQGLIEGLLLTKIYCQDTKRIFLIPNYNGIANKNIKSK